MSFFSWGSYFFHKSHTTASFQKVLFASLMVGMQDFLYPLTLPALSCNVLVISFILLISEPLTKISDDFSLEKMDFFLSEGLSFFHYSLYKILQNCLYSLLPLGVFSFLFLSLRAPYLKALLFSIWTMFTLFGTLSLVLLVRSLCESEEKNASKILSFCLLPFVVPLFVLGHAMIQEPSLKIFIYQFFLVFGQFFCMLGLLPVILMNKLKGTL
ncbi:MAG TPA: hypothetical protein VI959_04930 [Alphaproteobacteria bacterium]|nr:hypothetical protein [Alphaproteobacteria bacterium]